MEVFKDRRKKDRHTKDPVLIRRVVKNWKEKIIREHAFLKQAEI